MNKKIAIARISSAFGIKGEMKIVVYSDKPKNIEQYDLFDENEKSLKIKINNKNKTIIGCASGNPVLIVKIDGVNNREDAQKMCGKEVFALRENFAKTNEDEFYYADLIGLDVINMNSKKIGKVINILDHGGGGLVEIEFVDKALKAGFEKIDNFSFSNRIFPEVNLKKGFIRIDKIEFLDA
jgi:16S rRNA processing protein RimM